MPNLITSQRMSEPQNNYVTPPSSPITEPPPMRRREWHENGRINYELDWGNLLFNFVVHSSASPLAKPERTSEELASMEETIFPKKMTKTQAEEAHDCAICLTEMPSQHKLTECGHHFDQECLYHWLKTNDTCPLCRTQLL